LLADGSRRPERIGADDTLIRNYSLGASKPCGFGRPHDKHASQVKSETYALSFVNPLDNPLIYTT